MVFKNRIILLGLFIGSQMDIGLSAQHVGHTSLTFTDPSRGNRQIATEIYYPATATGEHTPVLPGVFPVIAFGHGFVMTWNAYQNIWSALVPEGYILAFPKTEGSFSPVHANLALDLQFIISEMKSNGAGSEIPSASVGKHSAIMGHSMGGGCSFLAAANNPGISTMVSFAAANTNPSSIAASRNVLVPTLIFSASNDCVTPPVQHQNTMYDSTAAQFKTQLYILGGGHCFFADFNLNCSIGEASCSPSPTITRTEQQDAAADFLKMWLARFLKDDCSNAEAFQDSLVTSPRINYRQSQSIACVSSTTTQAFTNHAMVYPNPLDNQLNVRMHHDDQTLIIIYDLLGQPIMQRAFQHVASLNTIQLTKGVYFYVLKPKSGNPVKGKFVKN